VWPGLGTPAYAAGQHFRTCLTDELCVGWTEGNITWYNRTANIAGGVFDLAPGTTTAIFDAFAGSNKIDTQVRSADDEGSTGVFGPINFAIGDPDLAGGINRIRITVCRYYATPAQYCSPQDNYSR
jgi:hypothetical protein